MNLAPVKFFAIDFFNGLSYVLRGPVELLQLKAANDAPPPPPPPRERTVLQMRREREGKCLPRKEEPTLVKKVNPLKRYMFCAATNVGVAAFLVLVIEPVISYVLSYMPEALSMPATVSSLLPAIAMLPIFIVTRLINIFCFADIASACYKKTNRPEPLTKSSISVAAADFVASILLELVFLIQSSLVKHLPLPGVAYIAVILHMSLLNSLYSFEYFWMSSGVPLRCRIDRIERRWPFFLGFGVPLTVLTTWHESALVQGCMFGALFPLFLIASYSADWTSGRLGAGSVHIPVCKIFLPSQLVTDKVSVIISERIIEQSMRRSPM